MSTIRSEDFISDLAFARQVFADGRNVTESLRSRKKFDFNTSSIIEIAYDLQAGSYIDFAKTQLAYVGEYAKQLSRFLEPHLFSGCTLLDVGCGELTNLTWTINSLSVQPARLIATDISWSRLQLGLNYFSENRRSSTADVEVVAADISRLPLPTKSIDIVMSNHALEPNGGREIELLSELLRVARHRLILFEPSYEINSPQGKERMDRLGYVRGLRVAAESLGARLLDFVPMELIDTPLNTTACHVFAPAAGEFSNPIPGYSDPGRDSKLTQIDNSYFSPQLGLTYPIVDGIAILRVEAAVLTSTRRS